MTTILVLGATGNIGFPLIQALAQQPTVKIVAGTHELAQTRSKFHDYPQVTLKKFDFLQPATFADALTAVDKVFFVRPPKLSHPQQDMLPFLRAAKNAGIKQIVFVSLIGVEKNPVTPHHKIEKMIIDLGLPYTFIRPSFFMQNLNTTHRQDIQQHHDLFIPAGKARTSFIDTRDIGAVAARCLLDDTYLNTKLDITGSAALTYAEVAQIMTAELNVPITYSQPSLLKFRRTMLKRGVPKDYANVMTMLYLITQLGNAKQVTPTLEQVLGRPPLTFAQYVHDYRNEFL